MADPTRGGVLVHMNAAHLGRGPMDHDHDRDSVYLSTGPQSGAAAALVVPDPLPRFAGRAPLPGMHQLVMLV
jgi:hypothetical protein